MIRSQLSLSHTIRKKFIAYLKKTKHCCQLLFLVLFSGKVLSQNTPAGANPFDSGGGFEGQETMLIYDQAQLLAMGYAAGNAIDTLCFNFTSRNSTAPYTNFNVTYYYTNPFFAFASGIITAPPVVISGGNVYSGTAAVSSTIPQTGGVFIIPLSTPIVWNGGANSLVIDICWTLNISMLSDSVTAIQMPGSSRQTARWRTPNLGVSGCGLAGSSTAIKNSSDWKPDIFTCNTITSITNTSSAIQLTINNVSFETDQILKIAFSTSLNNKSDISVYDISGRVVSLLEDVKTISGKNEISIPVNLTKGAYIISIKNEADFLSKLFIR